MTGKSDPYNVIGKRLPRVDGPIKATGRAQYSDDFVLAGMLHGKIVRSAIPRGRILHIDTSRAEKTPGVKAVIIQKDIVNLTTPAWHQLLRGDTVNFVGEEIAAVAAVDEDTASEAAELITIEYEPLKAVFSMEESIREGAPVLMEGHENNIADEFDLAFGDVAAAFSKAEHVRVGSDTYMINPNHNAFAEHHVAIADYSLPGKLGVWTPNQSLIIVQKQMAEALGIPEAHVRVISYYTGGAFSGRGGIRNHHLIAALLSRHAGRPVKIRCTADEEFVVCQAGGEHSYRFKTGVMKDGTLGAIDGEFLYSCGPYMTPLLKICLQNFLHFMTMYYRFDAARLHGRFIYTNTPPPRFHHGGGITGLKFAMEAELDHIARELEIDPVDLRFKNAFDKGDTTVGNAHFESCGLKECIDEVSKKSGWKKKYGKLPPYQGIGIGCGGIFSGGKLVYDHDTSAAFIKIEQGGSLSLFTGLPELGQGGHMTQAMIAAELLGVYPEDITVVAGDSDVAPMDVGAHLQRGTFVTGNAVKLACLDARKQLAETAAARLGVEPSSLVFRDKKIYPEAAPGRALALEAVVHDTICSQEGGYVMGKGVFNKGHEGSGLGPIIYSLAFSFGAQVAEVEVDPDTGEVRLLKMTVAHDVGRAINPMAVEGQIDGQVFSGMGQTLTEECIMEQGRVMNPTLLGYRLPRPFEVPEMDYTIVETLDPYGPFGAKEVGEGPVTAVSPAIASAVSNAIGYPITELPITPERVLRAIRKKRQVLP
jgi:CO/xanthine dehydrogenase Mo-binding subunit